MESKLAYKVDIGETGDKGFKALKQAMTDIFAATHPLGAIADPEDRENMLEEMRELPETMEEIKQQSKQADHGIDPKAQALLDKLPLSPEIRSRALEIIRRAPRERQALMVAIAGLSAASAARDQATNFKM